MKRVRLGVVLALLASVSVSVSARAANGNSNLCLTQSLDLFRKELLSEKADKEAFRSAAAELLYASEGDPKTLAILMAERVGAMDATQLDRGLSKYGPQFASEANSPLVREYLQNVYYAFAIRRDIPPSVIQDKIGYGTDIQRTYRLALVERFRKSK